MSRDIKFRAWNLVAIPKRMMSHKDICFYKDLKMYELFCDMPDNRPWIIMQYTGLHDKNGVEMYKDDLVKDTSGNIYRIVWRKKKARYAYKCIEDGSKTNMNQKLDIEDGIEVIGNIHENADLLK